MFTDYCPEIPINLPYNPWPSDDLAHLTPDPDDHLAAVPWDVLPVWAAGE